MGFFSLARLGRNRRSVTSSVFLATFVGSLLTVSASSLLPCPARTNKALSNQEVGEEGAANASANHNASPSSSKARPLAGERIALTGRKGWIQVEGPPG